MKKATSVMKIIKAIADKELRHNANSTTCTIFYQYPVPTKLARFKVNEK